MKFAPAGGGIAGDRSGRTDAESARCSYYEPEQRFPITGWSRVMTTEMLYQMLRARVQDGTYPVNEPMPTEVALQAEFKAARGTVRAARQRLVGAGLVYLGER